MNLNDTIAAIATGMNNSGIGIIRISGFDSFKIASSIFYNKNGKNIDINESHKVYYGFIKDDDKILDEVLLVSLKAPKSFTTEDTIEINCHGGNLVLRKVLNLIIKKGARLAEPGEFTKRAFLNGRIDLSKAEAVIDIINSQNDYALSNSINQLKGNLYDTVKQLREKIIYEIAFIESALDDPEHISLDGYSDKLYKNVNTFIRELEDIINSYNEGKIISEGISTVILGKPNVGKSSLLNLLSGENRAIVTDIAGTTRDIIEQDILLNGIRFRIIDTAGIRTTDDYVEKIGVEKSYEYANSSDLILMIIDSSEELTKEDLDLIKYIENKNAIILLNKSDLSILTDINDVKKYSSKAIIKISVKDNSGINEFKALIEKMFLTGSISYNDEIIITNERQFILFKEAVSSLKEVINGIDNNISEDFLSIDLSNSYNSLGKIIGEMVEDDVVNEIFSKFCMGK